MEKPGGRTPPDFELNCVLISFMLTHHNHIALEFYAF